MLRGYIKRSINFPDSKHNILEVTGRGILKSISFSDINNSGAMGGVGINIDGKGVNRISHQQFAPIFSPAGSTTNTFPLNPNLGTIYLTGANPQSIVGSLTLNLPFNNSLVIEGASSISPSGGFMYIVYTLDEPS